MSLIILISAVTINISAGPSQIDLACEISAIEITDFTTEEGIFSKVNINNEGIVSDVGKPEIPVIRRFIEIPWGAEAEIYCKSYESEEIILDKQVVPVQPPRPKILNYKVPFTIDKAAYEKDESYPALTARIVDDGVIRGHRVIVVEISPIQYNPVRSMITFHKKVDVRINLNGSDLGLTDYMSRRFHSKAFEPVLSDLILNYNGYLFAPPPDLPIGYLIITPDAWTGYLDEMVEWRKKKGYHVTVATKSQTGSSASQIKSYIENAYNNWPIPPSFVLLVGDVDQIPYWTGSGSGSPDTDLNYSCVEGSDYFPDVDLSRFSIANTTQLDSLVKKTVKYERNDWVSATDWCQKAYFIASSDPWNHGVAEATHRYCMAIVRSHGMVADSIWLYYGTGTPIVTALNDGRSWVTYSGHGSTTSWADPGFSVSDVHNLNNTDKIAFVQTYACNSGDFTYGECFSESWIRVGYRGAIAHIASSVTSYWDEDDILQRRIFDVAFDTSYHWIMGMVNLGKYHFYRYFGNTPTTRRYFEMYNLMGDGSIDVYGDVPHVLTVNHPSTILTGNVNLDVEVLDGGSPVENALVGVRPEKDDTVFAGYTNASGQVTIPVHTTQPETLYITVTGHSLETYEGHCMVEDVSVEEEELPSRTSFSLLSSNPVRSSKIISIRCAMAMDGMVDIALYDCAGKKISEIYSGFRPAGHYKFNMPTKRLRNGIYFMRYKAGTLTGSEKLILLK